MDDLDERNERNQSDDSAGDDCETNDAISEDEAKLDTVPEESDDDKDEETFIGKIIVSEAITGELQANLC